MKKKVQRKDSAGEILRLLMDRDFRLCKHKAIGLRRFAFPLQTPKIQRTRRETAFSPKNAVFTQKIIDALPQKVKDAVAPNYQRYMPKKSVQGLLPSIIIFSATERNQTLTKLQIRANSILNSNLH